MKKYVIICEVYMNVSNEKLRIAIVGNKDSILAFKALGMDVFYETERDKIMEVLKKLIAKEYPIILITEQEAIKVNDFLDIRAKYPFPIILPIPDGVNNTGYGYERIKKKIEKAIMRSTTDSDGQIKYDVENKPGVSNLLSIYSAFSGKTIPSLEKEYEGQGYGSLKKDLAVVTIDALRPIREKYDEIRHSPELTAALKDGAERANEIAEKTMARVKTRFGLGV